MLWENLRAFERLRGFLFPDRRGFAHAKRLTLHAIEQLLYCYRVRRLVSLGEKHRARCSDTAEHGREYQVVEDQTPRHGRSVGNEVHGLKERRHEQPGEDRSSDSEPDPADVAEPLPAIREADEAEECRAGNRTDERDSETHTESVEYRVPNRNVVDEPHRRRYRRSNRAPPNGPDYRVSKRGAQAPESFLIRHRSSPRVTPDAFYFVS